MAIVTKKTWDDVEDLEGYSIFRLAPGKTFFEVYESLDTFYEHYSSLEPSERTHYEILLSDSLQRPHFDLDIKKNKTNGLLTHIDILYDVLHGIMAAVSYLGYEMTYDDFMIYESNGATKYSYHVLLDRFYHNGNKEAKEFYKIVKANVASKSREFLDAAVYSSNQKFRLYGSSKAGEGRYKLRLTELTTGASINGTHTVTWPTRTFKEEFYDSLSILREKRDYTHIELPDANTPKPDAPMQLCSIREILKFIPPGFVLENVTKYGYRLRRVARTFCEICGRAHEHENAFININDSVVVFHCFRNQGKGRPLGIIATPGKEPDKEPERESEITPEPAPEPEPELNPASPDHVADEVRVQETVYSESTPEQTPEIEELVQESVTNESTPSQREDPVMGTNKAPTASSSAPQSPSKRATDNQAVLTEKEHHLKLQTRVEKLKTETQTSASLLRAALEGGKSRPVESKRKEPTKYEIARNRSLMHETHAQIQNSAKGRK